MEKKESKLYKFSMYIIFGLVLLLITSIIVNIFLYSKSQIRIFDCNLGEKVEIEFVEQSDTLLANLVYPSNIVSGTTYNQPVILKTGDITSTYFVRAKAIYADYNIVNENIDVTISPISEWVQGQDGYYYLQAYLDDYKEIAFIDSLTLPLITTEVKNNTNITIMFQFLESSKDVESIWKTPDYFFTKI